MIAQEPLARTKCRRCGLTLVELLISISMMALMAGALAVVARAVQMTSSYTDGYSTATQHARVSVERISRMVSEATGSESFPGVVAFATTVGGHSYPDTVVIWHPTGTAADPTGLPRFSELVVYAPNPTTPSELLEITNPSDTRQVPALSATSTWDTELANLKSSTTATRTILTDLMRTASASSGTTGLRAALRFEVDMRPTATEWANYKASTATWQSLSWPQGLYGSTTGVRQVSLRTELQLMPSTGVRSSTTAQQAAPFYGSGALYFQLNK